MGIFDSFFGIDRSNYKLPEIPNTKVGETVAEAQKKQEDYERSLPAYQIGITPDNRVTLKLSGTVTMTAEGVRHLIRMLEAAIPEYEVEDTVEENEEEDE